MYMWSCSKRLAYVVANLYAKESERRRQSTSENLKEQPALALLQHRVHFPDSAEKRPSR